MKRRWYAFIFLAALVGLSGQRADASRTPLTDVRASITQPHQLTAATAASDVPADAWLVESIIPLGTTADGQPLALISFLVPNSSLDELAPASTRAGPYAAPETHTRVFCIVQPPLGLAVLVSEKEKSIIGSFFGAENISFTEEGKLFSLVLGSGAAAHLRAYEGDAGFKDLLLSVAQTDVFSYTLPGLQQRWREIQNAPRGQLVRSGNGIRRVASAANHYAWEEATWGGKVDPELGDKLARGFVKEMAVQMAFMAGGEAIAFYGGRFLRWAGWLDDAARAPKTADGGKITGCIKHGLNQADEYIVSQDQAFGRHFSTRQGLHDHMRNITRFREGKTAKEVTEQFIKEGIDDVLKPATPGTVYIPEKALPSAKYMRALEKVLDIPL